MSDISIEIKSIDETAADIDKGKSVMKIEVSPNEKCLVICNQDDESITGWSVSDTDEEKLELDKLDITINEIKNLDKMCVSDDKKLAYVHNKKLGKQYR